jgi:hypothetical protein
MYKSITLLALVVATLHLTGCPDIVPPGHSGTGPTEDGNLCSDTASTTPVYIQIGYGPDGIPMVNPENCHVRPSTQITWRGPDGSDTAFEIDFKAASASSTGEDQVASKNERTREGIREKARISATSTPGNYDYAIKSNGKELDPSIIVN